MKIRVLLPVLMFLLIFPQYSQFIKAQTDDEQTLKKLYLISELQSLETEAGKLDGSLAHALAKAEIADALWTLDVTRAKALLRQAFELSLPPNEEQIKLRNTSIGATLTLPSKEQIARNTVRQRIFQVAGQDKAFAESLIAAAGQRLGKQEEHHRHASLATEAVERGDLQAASDHILSSMEAEPTLVNAGKIINDIAIKDRAAADKLIVQYIQRLRASPMPFTEEGLARIFFLLNVLVLEPNSPLAQVLGGSPRNQQVPPAGRDAVMAYISYILESLHRMEQSEPGSSKRFRSVLMSTWLPLKRYALELTGSFMQLEQLSRRPGEDSSLPEVSEREANRTRYDERIKKALDKDVPDEIGINLAISRSDFDKARKLISKLSDEALKAQFTEILNTREAISLATKGELLEASILAGRLKRATSLLQVYPVIISKCVAKKDEACATASVHDAVVQLKRADAAPPAPPPGAPPFRGMTKEEFDPVLSALGKLAKSVLSVNETLAFEALDEVVSAANRSSLDTGQGRTGFDGDLFKAFAAMNANRARQAAENLKNPLQRIVALAGIYQREAQALTQSMKAESRAAGAVAN